MIKKEELEEFIIQSNAIRFNPGVGYALAKRFGLDMTKIREGWMYKWDE